MQTFPKHIYQVWYQGCSQVSKQVYLENMKTWRLLNPTWKYSCVSHHELRTACAKFSPECVEAYDRFQHMHMKIDLGRYVLLYLYGGIYVDMDAYTLRGLDNSSYITNLIERYETNKMHVLGVSSMNIKPWESMIVVGQKQYLNNAVMLSSPGNPLLKAFIKSILERAKTNSGGDPYIQVTKTTGPHHFNKFFGPHIISTPANVFIKVFPPEVFEPCRKNKCNITEDTLSIHAMDATWIPSWFKCTYSLYWWVKENIAIILVLIIVIMFTHSYLRTSQHP